jgi:hypothetical protein
MLISFKYGTDVTDSLNSGDFKSSLNDIAVRYGNIVLMALLITENVIFCMYHCKSQNSKIGFEDLKFQQQGFCLLGYNTIQKSQTMPASR